MDAKHVCAALTALLLAGSAPAIAQDPSLACAPSGMTGQCNELGSIAMESDRRVDGEPVEITANIVIHNLYREREVRQFLFSVRNVTVGDSGSPVTVEVVRFQTAQGPINILRQDVPGPYEINMWIDVLDVPVNSPIELTVRVGATQQGGFKLETLAMPFDRAYKPLQGADGRDLSLFAFTFLSVQRPTPGGGGGIGGTALGPTLGKNLPGPEPVLVAAALVGAGLALRARPGARTPLRLFRRP